MDRGRVPADTRDVLLKKRPPALVTCTGCEFTWHSQTMAHGLRIAGSCVRCGGDLQFAEPRPVDEVERDLAVLSQLSPHQAMGLPRVA